MDVKSKIASFEAQNDQVRKTTTVVVTPPESPLQRHDDDVLSAVHSDTATSMASASRRERLQRDFIPVPEAPNNNKPETGGLKERMRARQLKQRQRLEETTGSLTTTTTTKQSASKTTKATTTTSGSSKPSQSSKKKKHPNAMETTKRSSRRSRLEKTKDASPKRREIPNGPQQGRLVGMINSMESDEDEPSRRAAAAAAKSSQQHRSHPRSMRASNKSPTDEDPPPPIMSESDNYFHQLLAAPNNDDNNHRTTMDQVPTEEDDYDDDDEDTNASLRQIMHNNEQQRANVFRRQVHHKPPKSTSSLTRDSSSSFDSEPSSHHPRNTLSQSHSSQPSMTKRLEDDDRTYDYGDMDNDSQASVTYEQRKEMERKAKEAKNRTDGYVEDDADGTSPLLNKQDMEFFGKNLGSPMAKTATGVMVAGTVGCIIMGPVGLLVGAAAVGLGVGIMQIPEEQRKNVQDKATKAVQQAHESAVSASERLSNSCATSCHDTGMSDAIPADLKQCFSQPEATLNETDGNTVTENNDKGQGDGTRSKGGDKGQNTKKNPKSNKAEARKAASPSQGSFGSKRRAAVLRHGHITPLNQIYSLAPASQPRAWLDVMASADTSMEEKNEAMEEINILAKDKRHARFLLDEGILDSLMWILTGYLEAGPQGPGRELLHAKLAASCCVTLGKAHCAAVHTGGDLLLMSMYERGTVPEERQLAQMLYEVPHHVQLAKNATEDAFVLKHVPMPQAEELAASIKALSSGQRVTDP